jgi:hypothetical protein
MNKQKLNQKFSKARLPVGNNQPCRLRRYSSTPTPQQIAQLYKNRILMNKLLSICLQIFQQRLVFVNTPAAENLRQLSKKKRKMDQPF